MQSIFSLKLCAFIEIRRLLLCDSIVIHLDALPMLLFLINCYCVFMKIYLVLMYMASRLQNSTSINVLK